MKWLSRASLCGLIVHTICALSAGARAEDEAPTIGASAPLPQIQVDVSPPDSAVVPLLRAEIAELGLAVVEAPSAGTRSITIQVIFAQNSLEVRIIDDATGKTAAHEVFSVAEGRPMDARTATLHAAELLRWHLHFLPASKPKAPSAPSPVAAPTPSAPASSDLRLGVLPMAALSPGGTRPGLGLELDLLRRWDRVGVRLLGAGTVVPNHLSVPEGSIDVNAAWVGLEGVWLPEIAGRTSLSLGVGAALFASFLRGTADADYVGQNDHLFTLAPLAELRLRERITPSFALVLGSTCLVPLAASRLRVVGSEIGQFGQVLVTLGLGAELTLL